ncbi:MAG: c-type cytochrome [Anaerolineae bacterium]
MSRSGILGIILILIGVLGLSFLGPGMMSGPGRWGMMGAPGGIPLKTQYASNGERIYYTGVSERTGPIRFQGGPMWLSMQGGGCVSCHGINGRGGVPVMMGTAIPADIRYTVLIEAEGHGHGKEEEEEAHSPYTDDLINQAITQGLDPANKPLDWTMPRWEMTEEDLNDLIAYLKTLH